MLLHFGESDGKQFSSHNFPHQHHGLRLVVGFWFLLCLGEILNFEFLLRTKEEKMSISKKIVRRVIPEI